MIITVLLTMFITNNRTLFHLWLKKNLVKQKVLKYHENDCRSRHEHKI